MVLITFGQKHLKNVMIVFFQRENNTISKNMVHIHMVIMQLL